MLNLLYVILGVCELALSYPISNVGAGEGHSEARSRACQEDLSMISYHMGTSLSMGI